MKEYPILFSGPMVNAILADPSIQTPKTMTRRIARLNLSGRVERAGKQWHVDDPDAIKACPYGAIGDRLWVRETWRFTGRTLEESRALTEDIMSGSAVDYMATYVSDMMGEGSSREDAEMACDFETWRPSIHMPRWACRIVLEITDIRIERLQDISEADAMAEGCDGDCPIGYIPAHQAGPCRYHFAQLWDSLNAKRALWASNPLVWALTFKVIQ